MSLLDDIDFSDVENINENIILALPSINHGNFMNIIYGIFAQIIKYINEIKKFISEEHNNLSKEDLQEFKNEILEHQRKINIINNVVNSSLNSPEQKEIKEKKNKIVFMETANGNMYGVKDINSIDEEYYEGFYELLKSIEDGTFKNVKMLTSTNNKTKGIAVVKSKKRRVVFDRIGKNTYAILGIFTKKSDMDSSYIFPLEIRIDNYRAQRNELIIKIKNQEYMLDQQEILDELYNKLTAKEEKNIKRKGGK